MAILPGAVWRPIPISSSRPRRLTGRGVCLHVAVSEATSLFDYFATADVDSHFYVARDGTIEQYVDTGYVAYAQLDGNATLISVESQGGVTRADAEPWTDAQLASLARIARWAHDVEGVPLQGMPNSLPASRGIGVHRLGIDPWRVAGGERWSSVYGKVCPGAAKISQVPLIISLAQDGDDDVPYRSWPAEDKAQLVADIWSALVPDRDQGPTATIPAYEALAHAMAEAHHARVDTAQNVWDRVLVGAPGDEDNPPLMAWEVMRSLLAGHEALTALVAQQNGLPLEDVRRVVAEEVAKGVRVTVAVEPTTAATAG